MTTDAFVLRFLEYRKHRSWHVTRALIEDTAGFEPGELWAHCEDMARRGLVVVEADTVRLP